MVASQSARHNSNQNQLLANYSTMPIRTAVHQNADGHINHSLFWRAMNPKPTNDPSGLLREAIVPALAVLDNFTTKFEEEGELYSVQPGADSKRWGKLEVATTFSQDNPIMQGNLPILLNDVWEHA
jgi:superoxide dismutase, Fe-Mn family